jgi:hypothetical protein
LRPQGFQDDNPPHLCEPLTCQAVEFSLTFVRNLLDRQTISADRRGG